MKAILKKLKNGFDIFDKQLKNNKFLIIYQKKNTYVFIEILFQKSHFLHLTGVEYDGKANKFYKLLSLNQINDVKLKRDGTTKQKIDVISNLFTVFCSPSNIGDYNNSGLKFSSDKILGKSSGSLSIGLKNKVTKYIPQSLLKEIYKKKTYNANTVLLVMRTDINSKTYDEVTYRNTKFDTLKVNDELSNKINDLNKLK